MAESHDDLPIHFGAPEFIEITKGARRIGAPIHNAGEMTEREMQEGLAETHGVDPDAIEIRRHDVVSRARNTVSFSGGWKASKWEPKGPAPNYGYTPNMN